MPDSSIAGMFFFFLSSLRQQYPPVVHLKLLRVKLGKSQFMLTMCEPLLRCILALVWCTNAHVTFLSFAILGSKSKQFNELGNGGLSEILAGASNQTW